MTREQAVLVTLVGYKLLLVAIGLISQRRNRDGVDFFLGGRGLGPLVAAISSSASSSSAWTLLGVSGFAWSSGASAVWLFPACVGGFALNWYLLAPALRRSPAARDAVTVTQVLAGSGESPARRAIAVLASLIVLVFLTSYVASQFQGAGKTFNETFGIGVTESVLIGAAIVGLLHAARRLLGGEPHRHPAGPDDGRHRRAPARGRAGGGGGGLSGMIRGMNAVEQAGFADPLQGMGLSAGAGFVLGLFGIGLGYPGQPHVVNRFMALRGGERELVRARRFAMVWAVIVYAGMLVLGWSGRVLFPGISDPEVVFLAAANELYPPVVAGVMVAAVLSAIMSTADSQLLVAASSVTWDLPRQRASGKALLRGSRGVVLVLSAAAALAALYGPREIFSPVLVAFAALGAAFGPLLLVTALRGPVAPRRTLTAMSAGLLLTVAGAVYRSQAGTAWGAACERVLPFAVALAIALWPGGADARRSD